MRLGGDDEENGPPAPPAAAAYPLFGATRQHRLYGGILTVFIVLILRSHLTRDYRGYAELRAHYSGCFTLFYYLFVHSCPVLIHNVGEAEAYLRAKGREVRSIYPELIETTS